VTTEQRLRVYLYLGVNNIVINLVFRYKQHIVKRSCLQCEDCSKKFADKHSDCNHASFQMFCLVFSFKTILDCLYGCLNDRITQKVREWVTMLLVMNMQYIIKNSDNWAETESIIHFFISFQFLFCHVDKLMVNNK
jgi:hypothetical protein